MSDLGAISELRIAPPRRAVAPWRRSDLLLLSIVLLFAAGVRAATIFVMARARAGVRPAAIASFLFAAVPISILYGGQPDVINAQLVFFILLTLAAYLRFHDRPSIGRLLLTTFAFALAAFTDWP